MKHTAKTLNLLSIIAILAFLAGCATPYQPTKTGLELQSFQKRDFETSKDIAFKSVLTVFQDLGYTIESAHLDTGFITAKSPTSQGAGFLGMSMVMIDTKATAQVDDIRENLTSIRLNFLNRREESGAYGAKSEKSTPVEDPQVYENAFMKIQESIFIRTESQ